MGWAGGEGGKLLPVGPVCTMRRGIILPLVFCGCEVMGRTKADGIREWGAEEGAGLQMEEVAGDERKLRRMRLAVYVARMGHNINAYRRVVNKLQGKRLLDKM